MIDPIPVAADRAAASRPSRWHRLAPVVGLWLLAPWAAESSWGGIPVSQYLVLIVFLAPLYGGAALLIRETARRTGGGWPVIVLLAGAFGVAQAGLVDQSLFNPDYLDDTEFAELAEASSATLVPVLGFSVSDAFSYIGGHIAVSICAPIAVVESMTAPGRREAPWLSRRGLVIVTVIYLLGSLLIFSDDSGRKGFLASPLQLTVATSLTLVLIVAALLPRWRRRPPRRPGRVPHPALVGLLVFVAYGTRGWVPGWPGIWLDVAVLTVVVLLIVLWSRREAWDQRHVLAVPAGALVSSAAVAYLVPGYDPVSPAEALLSDVVVTVMVLVVLGAAFRRLRNEAKPPLTADDEVRPGH